MNPPLFHWLAMLATLICTTIASEDGLTRFVSYAVNTTISSRFAQTHVVIQISNEKNCSTVRGFTFQLPLNARLTELTMTTTGNCEMNGVVKAEDEAQQSFAESAAQGQPAALLQAYDATNYGFQVSLPPLGYTVVEVHLEELLQRKRGLVDFQIPLYPGLAVQTVTMDVTIREPRSGVSQFGFVEAYEDVDVDLMNNIQILSTGVDGDDARAHFEAVNVTESNPLPRLLRAFYDPGPLPTDGLLLPDASGACFVHLFNPDSLLSSLGSLPRNIVFVIDVSGSMDGQKLDDAKAAFTAIIQKLTNDDFFAIHAFSSAGVEESFGPNQATADAIQRGQTWVEDLAVRGSTNLEGAYIEGIKKVEIMQTDRGELATYIPVVMVLTDGEPTEGETGRPAIARSLKQANHDGIKAKIYGLAFGTNADFTLLAGLSLQNGGRAVRIYEGFGSAASQMDNFYVGELGTIMMSDVNVSFDGTALPDSQTQSQFPIFAQGSEVAVRARTLNSGSGSSKGLSSLFHLGATTVANTVQGVFTWRAEINNTLEEPELLPSNQNECLQSFAHAKISELMLFRDVSALFGSQMDEYFPLYSLHNGMVDAESQSSSGTGDGRERVRRVQNNDLVRLAEEEALELALEARVVWPGLTAMVTVENEFCSKVLKDVAVCFDGDGIGFADDAAAGSDESEEDDLSGDYGISRPDAADVSSSSSFGSMVSGGGLARENGAAPVFVSAAACAGNILASVLGSMMVLVTLFL